MKKGLLLLAALAAAGSVSAKNQAIEDFFTLGISVDGKYIHGSNGNMFVIRSILDGQEWMYDIDHDAGNGNCWTADGMLVGNIDYFTPATWKDGNWTPLQIDNRKETHYLRGVTADGKIICGTMSIPVPEGDVEDYLMAVPCIYELQPDGTYSQPIPLPYPDKDIANRVPQYVTANNISDDGTVIVGQVVDGRGMLIYPIAFFKQADGSWEYELIGQEVVNPLNVTFPEYPGSGPIMPQAETYLTDTEREAYELALEEWDNQGQDYSTWPDPLDFLSGESLEAYDKAMEEFNKVYPVWSAANNKWSAAYSRVLTSGKTFEFNSISLSPDGRYFGLNAQSEAETAGGGDIEVLKQAPKVNSGIQPHDGNGLKKYVPYVFDLKDDSYKEYDTDLVNGVELTGVFNDGTIIGVNEPTPYPQTYLFLKGENQLTPLKDYISGISEETANWMNKNMVYDVNVYDPENDNYQLMEDYMITGIPYATPDLKTIVTTAYAIWTDQGSAYFTHVITPYEPTSVGTIENNAGLDVKMSADGIITLSVPADVEVYGITGAKQYAADDVTSVSTGLSKGIYVIKATTAQGETVTKKVVL